MPNSLTEPTGAEILAFFAPSLGEVPTVGTMDEATIDALIASHATNPVTVAVARIRALFADPDDITDAEYQAAYPAMLCAICHDLLARDMIGRTAIPNANSGGIEVEAYQAKMKALADQVASDLYSIGILESHYHYFPQSTAELIEGGQSW